MTFGRPWIAVADGELRRLWAAGTPTPAVAAALGRSVRAVLFRAYRLGLPARKPQYLGRRPGPTWAFAESVRLAAADLAADGDGPPSVPLVAELLGASIGKVARAKHYLGPEGWPWPNPRPGPRITPSPAEILRRAAAIRAARPEGSRGRGRRPAGRPSSPAG